MQWNDLASKEWSKRLFALVFGLSSMVSSHVAVAACGDTVDAPGKVFYVIPEGDLITREVTLTVPSCGKGSVVLSSESGWRTETTNFFSREVAGQKIFVVIFKNPQGNNPHEFLVLKGSYIRGKNAAKYWGDMYKLGLYDEALKLPESAESFMNDEVLTKYGKHAGGFGFKADVPAPVETPVPAPQTFID